MNVDFSAANFVADRAWYDASTGRLGLSADGYENSIPLAEIPDDDFESTTPIARFSVGQNGTVVVCHHKDGAETWLPVDIWLPGGFKGRSTK